MKNDFPDARDPLDQLLAARPIRPAPDFAQRVLTALRRKDEITDETVDRLLASQPCQPSDTFTQKVLQRVRAQPATAERLPWYLQQTLAWAAVALFSLVGWYQAVQGPSSPLIRKEGSPATTSTLAKAETPLQPATEVTADPGAYPQMEEILLLAEGLRDAGTLLDSDTMEVLAVMTR